MREGERRGQIEEVKTQERERGEGMQKRRKSNEAICIVFGAKESGSQKT